jgi:hypothetical protein
LQGKHSKRDAFSYSETTDSASAAGDPEQWEMHVCCIGATNAIAPIEGEKDAFMIYYGAGDAVTGAAKVVVTVPGQTMQ